MIKLKEYDEIICKRCKKVLNVKKTLVMKDGYRGYCICDREDDEEHAKCRHRNHVVKTRPADDDYNRLPTGQRVRKIPKVHGSKKERRRAHKEAIDARST